MTTERRTTPTSSVATGTLLSTTEEQQKPLLGQQIKGKFTSQDDLLFDAQQRSRSQSRNKEDTFTQQWLVFKENFLYNKKTNRYLGRTVREWIYMIIFYVVYYFTLAAIFGIFLAIFFVQVSVISPRLANEASIMKDYSNSIASPGMGLRPLPDYETTLITFQANKPETYKFYTDHMQSFLKSYQTVNARDDIRRKDCNQYNLPDKEVGCMFQPENKLGTCGKIDSQAALGYDDGRPCVLLKLNKMYGWAPDPIVCDSASDNTTSSCDGLSESDMQWFREVGRPGVPLHLLFNGQNVPVTCEGRHTPDVENLLGITWEPAPSYGSFPVYFYPYYNQRGYLAPLVGAQFNVSRAVLLMIRCRAWAKNIRNSDVASRDGAIHFELMVD